MQLRPFDAPLGAEVSGVDLRRHLDDDVFAELRRAWCRHGLLLFRGQDGMAPEHQQAFCGRFGALDRPVFGEYCLKGFPDISIVSNVMEGGRYIGVPNSGRNWHTDAQYLPHPPAGTFLLAREIPAEGGDTFFADMYAAYAALPEATRRRAEVSRVVHSRIRTWPILHPDRPPLSAADAQRLPDVVHPLVRTHPETGRKALYVGGNVAWAIEGMPLDEGQALIRELRDFAVSERFVYRHRWRDGDALLWDNRSTMHCATWYDDQKYRRIMHRCSFAPEAVV